jgi:hypothetical protein
MSHHYARITDCVCGTANRVPTSPLPEGKKARCGHCKQDLKTLAAPLPDDIDIVDECADCGAALNADGDCDQCEAL